MSKKLPIGIFALVVIATIWVGLLHGASVPAGNIVISRDTLLAGDIPTYSGIENIYIVKITQVAWDIDFGTLNENVLGVITASTGSCDVPYETAFAIVVAVKGHDENMAYVVKENLKVELTAGGSFEIAAENSADANEYVFAESAGVYIRVNAVWDNATVGYKIPAGGSVSLTSVKQWCWS